jgi:AraC-like DNA-binding protein
MQRVGVLSELPGLLREHGVRPGSVLRRAGFAADALAEREHRVPYAAVGTLLAECVRATGCAHFALQVGERSRLEHFGLAGEVAGSCATVGEGIEAFASFHWLNSSGGTAYLARAGNQTALGYAIFEPGLGAGVDQIHDLVAATGVQILRALRGSETWAPQLVRLARTRTDDPQPYRALFRCPVQFDADGTSLIFPRSAERAAVPGGDEVRHRVLLRRLLELGQEAMLPRLLRTLRVALVFGLASGDDIAAAMGLSRRTLNRRLAEAGTNFRASLDEVRFEAARALLAETRLSMSEIAAALAFSDQRPFVRAFRRWSGEAPGAWRAARTLPPAR